MFYLFFIVFLIVFHIFLCLLVFILLLLYLVSIYLSICLFLLHIYCTSVQIKENQVNEIKKHTLIARNNISKITIRKQDRQSYITYLTSYLTLPSCNNRSMKENRNCTLQYILANHIKCLELDKVLLIKLHRFFSFVLFFSISRRFR